MTSLLDKVRLEVLTAGSTLLVPNHSGQDGVTTGWTNPGSGPYATIEAVSGLPFGYDGHAIRVTPSPTRFGFSAPRFPALGGQWINLTFGVHRWAGGGSNGNLTVRYFNASNVEIFNPSQHSDFTIPEGSGVPQTYTLEDLRLFYPYIPGPRQAPAGTVTVQVDFEPIDWTDSGEPFYVWEFMAVVTNSASTAARPVFSDLPEQWQNIIGGASSIAVKRGGDVDGVTDVIDVGMLTARLRDPLMTPENNEYVRPGRPIRLTALNGSTWDPVFVGKLVQASTEYPKLREPIVTLTATDAWASLANYSKPYGYSGTFRQRIAAALLDVPVAASIHDTATDTASGRISVDDGADARAQIALAATTLQGLAYCDKSNRLQAFASNSYPTQTPSVSFSDTHADADAIYYTQIATGFDSKNVVNSLTVTKNALTELDGSKTYGPYLNQASVDEWGSVGADVIVNDGNPATIAAALLAVYSRPTIKADSVTYQAVDSLADAIERELYEAVAVKFGPSNLDDVCRIISIEHTILAGVDTDRWEVTLGFKPLEDPQTITVTNPSAGANTGPVDVVGTLVPQSGRVSVPTTTANVTASVDVTFPTRFAKVPEVTASVFSTVPQNMSTPGVTDVTVTGFTIYLRRSTAGATTVRWIAVPT